MVTKKSVLLILIVWRLRGSPNTLPSLVHDLVERSSELPPDNVGGNERLRLGGVKSKSLAKLLLFVFSEYLDANLPDTA